MSVSDRGLCHPIEFLGPLDVLKGQELVPQLVSREIKAQDFGARVSRPRSASSEIAEFGNSFLSCS